MLTGESVPISKTSLQRNRLTSVNSTSSFKEEEKSYDAKEHSKHTLFRGTKVIQTRNHRDLDTIAVVIRTGNKLHCSFKTYSAFKAQFLILLTTELLELQDLPQQRET